MSQDGQGLIRVMALHSLAYCERLYYLEEVEEIRVADEAVFGGRALHALRAEPEFDGVEWRDFDLESQSIGLTGKVDAFRRRDGYWTPYEHKKGRCATSSDGTSEAWRTDRLQVAGYALLLEELLNEPVPEARVRYHSDNITIRVPITDELRHDVRAAVARAHELAKSSERPSVTSNANLCRRCSLAPVCLPEEERLSEHAKEIPRLFPEAMERTVVHVVDNRARVGRSGMTLLIESNGDQKPAEKLPIEQLGAVVIHGNAQVTTQALQLCAKHSVGVHWVSAGGRYVGGLAVDAGTVQRRIRQYKALADPDLALSLAKQLARARIESQLRYLLRATRNGRERTATVYAATEQLRREVRSLPMAASLDSVRGHEGAAGRAYFGVLGELILPERAGQFRPAGRNRQPPRDRFNALLSFGYALLYRAVMQAILAVGLEPAFGFFHTPRSAAHPLVLDLMELFRVPIWDLTVVGSINRGQWAPGEDFVVAKDHVWLSDHGRRKAITLFESRLEDVWRHEIMRYSLTYGRAIELEVRLLEKEWTGRPGLFARSRIR